jgi:hypothetical protein
MSTIKYPNRPPRSFATAALSAAVLTSATLVFTSDANAAPAGPDPVDQTVSQLQADGYEVIVNKVGTTPLSQCAISSVRPGQTYARTDSGSGAPGAHDDLVTTVTGQTVYIDVAC